MQWSRDEPITVTDLDSLDAQLDLLHDRAKPRLLAVFLSHHTGGPVLTMTVGGHQAVILYTDEPNGVAQVSTGDPDAYGDIEIDHGGQTSTLPATTLIPTSTARAAARTFHTTGHPPEDLT
jgi:hypothetical protein